MSRHLPIRDAETRNCGDCALCCTLMGVPELGKAEHERCVHQAVRGCGIYHDRPESCKAFKCFYLLGLTPSYLRPDKIDAVITTNRFGNLIVVNEAKQGAHRRGRLNVWLQQQLAKGLTVLVMNGPKRYLLSPDKSILKS